MTTSQMQAACKPKLNCDLCAITVQKDVEEAEKDLIEFKKKRPAEDLVEKYLKLTVGLQKNATSKAKPSFKKLKFLSKSR